MSRFRPLWTEVIPDLYLSGYGEWPEYVYDPTWGTVLCMLETCVQPGFTDAVPPNTIHLPLLVKEQTQSRIDGESPRASVSRLNDAAEIIDNVRGQGERVLVHCGGGMERSPLTVAWYLVKHHREEFPDLDAAYDYIKRLRPIVQDRQSWLPWTLEGKATP
jgi:protein-tyrosine phosphatase